jgi:hypothetical protein
MTDEICYPGVWSWVDISEMDHRWGGGKIREKQEEFVHEVPDCFLLGVGSFVDL